MFGPSIAVARSEGKDVFATQGGPVPTEGDYLDSLDRIEFGMATEEEFAITVPDVIVKDWRNLDQVAEYVSATVSKPLHGRHRWPAIRGERQTPSPKITPEAHRQGKECDRYWKSRWGTGP